MSIDESINRRLSRVRGSNNKKRPKIKKVSIGRKVWNALGTLEDFIILNHLKEGRITNALFGVASKITSAFILRPSKSLPKRKSVLSQRRASRKARKAKIARFRVQPNLSRRSRQRPREVKRTLI